VRFNFLYPIIGQLWLLALKERSEVSPRRSSPFRCARPYHEGVALRSGRTKRLPALLLQRLAPDPLGEDLERGLCLGIRAGPDAPNLAHFTGEKPEQRPWFIRLSSSVTKANAISSRCSETVRSGCKTFAPQAEAFIKRGRSRRSCSPKSARGAAPISRHGASRHEWLTTYGHATHQYPPSKRSQRLPRLSHRPAAPDHL
jgi:hypothetical protein